MTIAFCFVLGLLVSMALTPVGRAIAVRLGYLAENVGGRPARTKARFGGIAVGMSLFIGATAIGAFDAAPVLLVSGLALFLFGIASERLELKPATKLVALVVVASAFLFFDLRLRWADSLILDSILTVFWIVGITSAFNLLDNMDGLCAGIALIAGTAFLFTVLPVDPVSAELFARTQYLALLLGAIAGFLIYNVYPASVALGDSGSLLVGLNMAAMTLQVARGRGSDLLSVVAVPVLVLLIPIVDAVLAALLRVTLVSGGHRQQPSRRLVALGLSERAAVMLLWALAGVSGLIGVAAGRSQYGLAGLLAAMFTIGMALFAVYLGRVQVHENVEPHSLPATITPLGIEFAYRRWLGELVLDLLLISVAYNGAYRLRFEGAEEYAANFRYFVQSFPIVLGTQMVALFVVGAYRGTWRYFGLSDGVTFASGVFLGVVTSQALILYLYQFHGYSPGIFIVYGMLLLLLLVGSRASFRVVSEFIQRQRHSGQRLAIYGAGDSGSIAVRHLLSDPRSTYRIVGFIDDDARKRNVRVHGYRIIGGYDHLAGMIMAREIDAVAVTDDSPAAPGLGSLCAKYGVTLHRLGIDWQDLAAADALAAGAAVPLKPVEPRILPFTDAGRERTHPESASLQRAANIRAVPTVVEHAPPPIRVVHIITRLILGGAQENTLYTAIGQHRDPRFDVTLLVGIDEAGEGNMFSQATRAGVKTIVLPSLLREIRPLTDLKAIWDVYRFLRDGAYAIVHTHSSKAGIIGRLAARAAGVPVVVHTVHGFAFHEFQAAWKNRLFTSLERLCAPLTARIISVSSLLGQTALSHGIGRSEQHVTIFSGIELELFLSARERLNVEEAKRRVGIPSDVPVVGKIARLFPLKGHEQFLQAAVAIAKEFPDAHFLLVGDGPLREELRQEADRLGIGDRLVLVGRVPPETVPDYIQAMDVVVHTSLREGIARVLPQAGAVGKPVVTFNLDGAPEVVRDGVSGYLVPPLDVEAIAARTVQLLRDAELRRRLGDAGRAFAAEHFSVERMVDRINTLYLELVEVHAPEATRRPAATLSVF